MRLTVPALLCALSIGCTRQAEPQPPPATQTLPPQATGIMPPAPVQPSSTDVMVEVNGKPITRGQAMLAIQRARTQGQNINVQNAVQKLIANTLLVDEMQRLKIDVTDEEIAAERKIVAKTAPEGSTLEEMMAKNGISEEYLKRALEQRIRGRKFLAAKNFNVEVTDKEYQDHLAGKEYKTYVTRHEAVIKERAAKKKEIEAIRKQLIDGADFAELAKEHSNCPSGKREGGNLGSFGRGQMVPEFEQAAFSQKTNEIGRIVETKHGFHIIQVLEKSAAGDKKKQGVPVPEHVRARHILLSAPREPPPLPDKRMITAMLESRKTNMAFAKMLREDLVPKANIKYVGMQAPQPAGKRPTVQPAPPGVRSLPPGAKIRTSPPKSTTKKMVTSKPVAAPPLPKKTAEEEPAKKPE